MQVGQRAPALVQAEPVAREQLVGNGEADEAERKLVHEPPVRPVEQGHGREAGRIAQRERPAQEVQGQPGVDDVLDEEHVTILERRVDVLEQPHRAVLAARVRRELDDVERVGDAQRTGEVGEEDDARLQRRDEDRVEAGVCRRDLLAELPDPRGDRVAAEVDVADDAVLRFAYVGHYEANCRR